MKKYIVLSVNYNVDYLYYTPLTCWAWRQFGWEPIVLFQCDNGKEIHQLVFEVAAKGQKMGSFFSNEHLIKSIEGYRSDTITQVSRLYASHIIHEESYIMTGDIDMIPLSDYWKNRMDISTVYGHDLTGFGHYPICYIGMPKSLWDFVMSINSEESIESNMKRDLDSLPQAKDTDFYKYWFTDQDLITDRLKQYGTGKIDFINRGQGKHGYARGRIDRATNGWVLDQPELIDAHLEQQTWHNPAKVQRLYDLLAYVWPGEDFTWFKNYTHEFKKLAI